MASAKKKHERIDGTVAAHVMFLCDRTCCVCRTPGKRGQIHHIDEDPSNSTEENLAFLCFECHDQTQLRGGFGRTLDAAQVIRFRDEWYDRVRQRRDRADQIAVAALTTAPASSSVTRELSTEGGALLVPGDPPTPAMVYAMAVPNIRRLAAERARPLYHGSTVEMREARQLEIDALVRILVGLAAFYPANHFGKEGPPEYFSARAAEHWRWHSDRIEVGGQETGGTIVPLLAGAAVLAALEQMVSEMVQSVLGENRQFDLKAWQAEWDRACTPS